MSQKQTWPLVTSIILGVLSLAFWGLLLLVPDINSDPTMIAGCIFYMVYALIFWLPTFIHSSPKVFLINLANVLCCFAWIGALVVAIMDKKNPNGTSMPAWNQNPTWDNTNAQNYWSNGQNNQWGNSNGVQGQQPVQPTNWESTPNSQNQPYMNNDVNVQNNQGNSTNPNQNGGW